MTLRSSEHLALASSIVQKATSSLAQASPISSWLAANGLNIGIGTDSAVSNNTHDLFEEMRFGLLMQRAINRDPVAVTAETMLRIATIGGARALGMESLIGTLTPGKHADIIAIDLHGAHATPATDPYSALPAIPVRASDVIATYVDGDLLYDRGHWNTMDAPAILSAATEIRARLSQAD